MSCKFCKSERLAFLEGKVNDMGSINLLDKIDIKGYMPYIEGICGGDYIDMLICFDCGKIQREWPLTDKEILNEIT